MNIIAKLWERNKRKLQRTNNIEERLKLIAVQLKIISYLRCSLKAIEDELQREKNKLWGESLRQKYEKIISE